MIMMALDRQKILSDKCTVDSVICSSKEGRRTAFKLCEELRRQGLIIEMDVTGEGPDAIKKAAKDKGIGGIIYIADDEKVDIHNLQTGEITNTSISDMIKSK